MKKRVLICLSIFFSIIIQAQTNQAFQFKGEYVYGNILKHTKHLENLVKGPVTGGEFAVEWQTMGEKPWHQFLSFPKVGMGAVYLNLGNPDTLGNAFALYPYINIPLLRTNFIKLYIKPGAGISYLTKTFKDATAYYTSGGVNLDRSNAAIGSHINVYFAGSVNFEIPIAAGLSLTGDCGWNHVSNGSFIQPNSGINMLNGFIGLKYFPNHKKYDVPEKKNIAGLPKRLTAEITVSGGARQLYYKDNRFFPIGSVSLATFYPLTNFYRMGLGADAFYDGVYGEVNASSVTSENETKYMRTYIASDELKNKLRAGISWQNELIIGKLTAGIHFGIYLYNPIKYLEPVSKTTNKLIEPMPNKGVFYSYNIDPNSKNNGEDGWLYTRASLKYALSKHIFAAVGLKTHLQKAEFIEWGLGYRF